MDKPKLKTRIIRKPEDVILQHRCMILATLIVIVLITPWLIPPQVDHLVWQMHWRNLSLMFAGLGLLPVGIWLHLTGLPVHEISSLSPELIITLAILPVVIWGMARIIRLLWRSVLPIQLTVAALFAGNLLCGWIVANLEGFRAADPITCEHTLTDDLSLRMVSYQVTRGALGDSSFNDHYLFLLTSDDAGHSWEQRFFTTRGVSSDWLCLNIHALDGTFFWSWAGAYVVTSHDGGRTWAYSRLYWDWEYVRIRTVVFEDHDHGYANVVVYPHDEAYTPVDFSAPGEPATYRTADGGRTWTRADDSDSAESSP